MHDWNDTKHDAILLIHPMLSSADDMKTFIANNLGNEYRYLTPDLAAHGDACEATYRGAAHEAEEIRSYLTSHDASNLKLGFGASLGGVVLLHLLKYDDIHFEHLFFEGTSFFTNAKMLYRIVLSQLLKKHGKAQSDPELCRRKMVDAFGESAATKLAKHFIGMNEESIRCIAHDCSFVELPTLSAIAPIGDSTTSPTAHAEEIQTGTRGGKTATIGGVDRKNRWRSGRIPYRSNGRKRGANENLAGGTAGGIEDHVFVLVETDISARGLGKDAIGQQNLPPVAEGKRIVVGVAHGMYSRIADGERAGIATFDAVSASAHIERTILNAHSKGGASVEEQSDARGIDG